MTEQFIQKALFRNFSSHKFRFTNIFFFNNESDFLSFLPSGFCYEIEIKVSKQDFLKDFHKDRHNLYSQKDNNKTLYLTRNGTQIDHNPSWELTAAYPKLVTASLNERYHHRYADLHTISFYMDVSSKIDFREVKNDNLPNKFFYAVPAGMIKVEDIPDYAGLLYVYEDLTVEKIKDGKFIHKQKIAYHQRVFNKLYYSYEKELINKLNIYK